MNDRNLGPSDAELEAMLRGFDEQDLELLDPPDDVWDGIEAAMGAAAAAPATVTPLGSRQRRARGTLIGVAAAIIVAVVAVVAVYVSRDDSSEILATATLAYDPATFDALGATAGANADLVSDDGTLRIDIVEATLPSPGEEADLEVWLIEPDAEGNVADLVSLGVVDPSNPGGLEVPPSHDPAVYYVVDISVEPRDGDASHSGRSILRGPLSDI